MMPRWFDWMIFGLLALAVVLVTWDTYAQDAPAPFRPWVFLGEGSKPAALRDCDVIHPGARLTINTNVETGGPWRRFCIWRKE